MAELAKSKERIASLEAELKSLRAQLSGDAKDGKDGGPAVLVSTSTPAADKIVDMLTSPVESSAPKFTASPSAAAPAAAPASATNHRTPSPSQSPAAPTASARSHTHSEAPTYIPDSSFTLTAMPPDPVPL